MDSGSSNQYANMLVYISEFDQHLIIRSFAGRRFYHGYFPGVPGTGADINTNGFDYNVNGRTGEPVVWRAMSGTNGTGNPLFLQYHVWQLSGGQPYEGTNAMEDPVNIRLVAVDVPLYQASELFGVFFDVQGNTWRYTDSVPTNSSPSTPGIWGECDPRIPGEEFEDFLSWWNPNLGLSGGWTWVDVRSAPHYVENPNALTNGRPDRLLGQITWDEYVGYITSNYPGDVAGLIARAGNGVYDGPDNWRERTNNMYRWSGYLSEQTAYSEETPGTRHWCFNVGHTNYGGFFRWYANYFPLSSGASGIDGRIPNVTEEDPGNSKELVGGWIPRLNTGWSYDGPREFCDMPSSMFHSAGDGRLGEITSHGIIDLRSAHTLGSF